MKALGPQLGLLILEQGQFLPSKIVHGPVGGAVSEGGRDHCRWASGTPPIGRGRIRDPEVSVEGLARSIGRLEFNDGRDIDGSEARIVSRGNVLERQLKRAVGRGNGTHMGSVGIRDFSVGIGLPGASETDAPRGGCRGDPMNHLLRDAEAIDFSLDGHLAIAGVACHGGHNSVSLRGVLHLLWRLVFY